jgi:hypothetical protein
MKACLVPEREIFPLDTPKEKEKPRQARENLCGTVRGCYETPTLPKVTSSAKRMPSCSHVFVRQRASLIERWLSQMRFVQLVHCSGVRSVPRSVASAFAEFNSRAEGVKDNSSEERSQHDGKPHSRYHQSATSFGSSGAARVTQVHQATGEDVKVKPTLSTTPPSQRSKCRTRQGRPPPPRGCRQEQQ